MSTNIARSNPTPQAIAAIEAYFARQAELNEIEPSAIANGNSFAVTPTVQQTLHERVQHSSDFLSGYVNFLLVNDISGEKVFITDDGIVITSTTNVDRVPIDPSDTESKGYQCRTNDFDILLSWSKLNSWAKFPDFQVRLTNFLLRRQALDHIKIGFNGISFAGVSDRAANPLGEDVNIGWLQTIRAEAPAHVVDAGAGVTFGTNQTYKNIDALALSARYELLDEVHRERGDLVVVLGSQLITDKYFRIMNKADIDPSEYKPRDVLMNERRIGAMEAISVPFFPANALLIMPRQNLSVYVQEMSRRAKFEEQHASRGYVSWFTHNVDYVVEDLTAVALVENITENNA